MKKSLKEKRLGTCLYRRGGRILARVRVDGKLRWISTKTDNPKQAREWLKKWRVEQWQIANGIEPRGVTLQRRHITVSTILDEYVKAGCPTRKNKTKNPQTVRDELRFMQPLRKYFGAQPAAGLGLGDCDKYFNWRTSGGYVSTFKIRGHPRTKATKGGKRIVDAELGVLSNALNLAVRRGQLKTNPLIGRGRYTSADEIRHCREVAPTPEALQKIVHYLRGRNESAVADLVSFLACSGLRIGEALGLKWDAVNWAEGILHVKREKRGVNPWVAILPEMETLLHDMSSRSDSPLLFPSPFNPGRPRDHAAIRHRLTAACKALKIPHVTPHGLRSYFVTQARQCGLTDAEIAMLIGDKSGPAIIAHTYGDVRPDHLLAQARRIRLFTLGEHGNNRGNTEHQISEGRGRYHDGTDPADVFIK